MLLRKKFKFSFGIDDSKTKDKNKI